MKFKKELETLVEQLEKFDLDRRAIECELGLSEKYLDQQISTGGNIKLVASLKMLLRVKTLEKTLAEKDSPAQQSQANENLFEILEKIDKSVERVGVVTADAREHTLLTEALSRALVYHAAHMEMKQFGGDYLKISEDLHEVTSIAYQRLRLRNSASQGDEKVA